MEGCARKWRLQIGDTMSEGHMSCIVTATDADGALVVLKCIPDPELAQRELEALGLWRDNPAVVRLLAADLASGTALLERVTPGGTYAAGDSALERIAGLLRELHAQPAPAESGLPTLREQIGWQLEKAAERLERLQVMDPEAFAALRALASSLSEPGAPASLLHGDLQPRNILTGANDLPVLIDPRPSVGDPAFDAATWALKQLPVEGAPDRAKRLALALELDLERVTGWMRILAAETALSRLHHRFANRQEAEGLLAVARG